MICFYICIYIYIYIYIYVVIIYPKNAQDCHLNDVLGVLTSFGSSNIMLVLPGDLTQTIIPPGDPAAKSRSTQ